MNDERQEVLDAQEESQLRSRSATTAQQIAAEQTQRTVHNEGFLRELLDEGWDSETFAWVLEEYPEWFADARAMGNRGDHWDQEADLIMANKRERAIAEGRPGRLLRTRPFMHAAMVGAESPQLDAYDDPGIPGDREYWRDHVLRAETPQDPVTSEEARAINGAAEVAADQMSLSRNATGIDSVSTVKTDSTVRKQSEEESTKERLGRFMG